MGANDPNGVTNLEPLGMIDSFSRAFLAHTHKVWTEMKVQAKFRLLSKQKNHSLTFTDTPLQRGSYMSAHVLLNLFNILKGQG